MTLCSFSLSRAMTNTLLEKLQKGCLEVTMNKYTCILQARKRNSLYLEIKVIIYIYIF